eukprot:CAMPEP_0176007562 /NCGR_PEP_ID=MMETSP0120_2-20121206/3297_1 /TAXON_ID=160619 /ORGANISM="Kryptoperidinium foliaceum, Strain CCMP 1326" /LENGTH=736 /DNA_ID=CAMNT_0017340327 /DNA_START=1 /DNA_END=2211 /DNA_ORIENTATION=+
MFLYTLLSSTVLGLDLLLLPYALAWNVDFEGIVFVFACVTPAFWTIDLCLNFLIGYYREGEIILDLKCIARAYCLSWLAPDATVVLCDWASLALQLSHGASDSRSLKVLRFLKLGRWLRIADILRVIRTAKVFAVLAESAPVGYRLVARIVSLFGCVFWICHFMAASGSRSGHPAPSDTGCRWTDDRSYASKHWPGGIDDASFEYQYLSAFHWAVGQVSLAGSAIQPTNSWELGAGVASMMFGFLFGSMLVSMMSASMMDYHMMQKDRISKLRMLRRYLSDNKVSAHTAVHVQKQVEQRLKVKERLNEGDVAALQLLSTSLRSQLCFEIQRPHISRLPVFAIFIDMDVKLMQRVCAEAVTSLNMRPKDDLFAPSSIARCAHVLVGGAMVYLQSPDTSPVIEETSTDITPGQWLAEATLWVEWTHVGRAEARDTCQVLSIDSEALAACLRMNCHVWEVAIEYGMRFHERVTMAVPPQAAVAIGLRGANDKLMRHRRVHGPADTADDRRRRRAQRRFQALDKLREEVRASRSVVAMAGNDEIVRVVSLVALRATRANGDVFMQVGRWSGEDIEVIYRLPGMKQEAGEHMSETLDRLLETRLSCLIGTFELQEMQQQIEEKESKDFGIHTRYLRLLCNARFCHGMEVQAAACMVKESLPMEMQDGNVANGGKLAEVHLPLLQRLQSLIVYANCTGPDSGNLYTFIPTDLCTQLDTQVGDKALKVWLAGLELPPARDFDI